MPGARRSWINPAYLAAVALGCALLVAAGVYVPHTSLFAISLAAFMCEFVDSAFGMGFGTMLAPLLLVAGFSPTDVVPVILVSELLTGFGAAFFHAKDENVSFARGSKPLSAGILLSIGSVLGVFIGAPVFLKSSTRLLTLFIGVIITISGVAIFYCLDHAFRYRRAGVFTLATIAAFNKTLSGGGYGPLMTSGQLLVGVEAKAAAAITSLSEGVTCLCASAIFVASRGHYNLDLLIAVLTGSLLVVPLATGSVRRLNERTMKKGIGVATLILGCWTVLKALR
ncbi:MAG: sulfite exporter TauE/SafE family protein [Polyangia bacterium]|jgi:uncharacterized membrane protein YfcA